MEASWDRVQLELQAASRRGADTLAGWELRTRASVVQLHELWTKRFEVSPGLQLHAAFAPPGPTPRPLRWCTMRAGWPARSSVLLGPMQGLGNSNVWHACVHAAACRSRSICCGSTTMFSVDLRHTSYTARR